MKNLIGLTLGCLLFISCGSSEENTAQETEADFSAPSIELSLSADDNMKYDKSF